MAKKDQSYDNLGRITGTGVSSETEPLVDPMAQAEMADGNHAVSQSVAQAPAVAQPTIQQQVPVTPVVPVQSTVVPEVQVNSANNYTLAGNEFNRPEFNKKFTDKATPETGLQFKSNGEVIFAREDKVSRPYIIDILNKAGANIDPNMPYTNETWNLIRDKYNELHSQGKVIPTLEKEGYLTTNTAEPKPTKEQEVQKIVEEAQRTNRSFLDIYKEHIKAPEYEKDRAGRLQGAKRLSLLSDIIKTVGEGVTTNQGGTPIQRKSVVPYLNDQLQKLNDLYNNQVQTYNAGKFNYAIQDENNARAAEAAMVAARRKAAADLAKNTEDTRRWEAEFGLKKEQFASDKDYKAALKQFKEKELAIRAANKKTSGAAGSGKSSRSGGSSSSAQPKGSMKVTTKEGIATLSPENQQNLASIILKAHPELAGTDYRQLISGYGHEFMRKLPNGSYEIFEVNQRQATQPRVQAPAQQQNNTAPAQATQQPKKQIPGF